MGGGKRIRVTDWPTGPEQRPGLGPEKDVFCLACGGFELLFSFAFLWEQMFINPNSHKKTSFPEQHRRADLSSWVGPEFGCPRGEAQSAPVTHSPCQYDAPRLLPAGPVRAVASSKSRFAALATCSWWKKYFQDIGSKEGCETDGRLLLLLLLLS